MASGRLIDYLGIGLIADRPASLDLFPATLGLWYATDSDVISVWDGSAWRNVAGTPVDSVNGQIGAVELAIGNLVDVLEPTGGWQVGDLLAFDGDAWVSLALGVPGQVLTVTSGGLVWDDPAADAVSSVNGKTGAVDLVIGDLGDVAEPTGGWQFGDLLTFDGDAFVPVTFGAPGQVLTATSGGIVWDEPASGGGDVTGPAGATDNSLPRFDGATGKQLQGSGVLVGDSNEISGYKGHLNLQIGTTYEPVAADTGKIIDHANAAAIAVTLPNSAAVGFCCTYVQSGAGQITFAAASGGSLRNASTQTKTRAQWSEVTLYVRSNAGGTAAEWVLGGDTAA